MSTQVTSKELLIEILDHITHEGQLTTIEGLPEVGKTNALMEFKRLTIENLDRFIVSNVTPKTTIPEIHFAADISTYLLSSEPALDSGRMILLCADELAQSCYGKDSMSKEVKTFEKFRMVCRHYNTAIMTTIQTWGSLPSAIRNMVNNRITIIRKGDARAAEIQFDPDDQKWGRRGPYYFGIGPARIEYYGKRPGTAFYIEDLDLTELNKIISKVQPDPSLDMPMRPIYQAMLQNVRDQLERNQRDTRVRLDRDVAKYLAERTQMPPSMICKHLIVPEDTVKGWRWKARRNTKYRGEDV